MPSPKRHTNETIDPSASDDLLPLNRTVLPTRVLSVEVLIRATGARFGAAFGEAPGAAGAELGAVLVAGAGAGAGVEPVLEPDPVTRKLDSLHFSPSGVVIDTLPVVASAGTTAWKRVDDSSLKDAGWLWKRTACSPSRYRPSKVTSVPARPDCGDIEMICGYAP